MDSFFEDLLSVWPELEQAPWLTELQEQLKADLWVGDWLESRHIAWTAEFSSMREGLTAARDLVSGGHPVGYLAGALTDVVDAAAIEGEERREDVREAARLLSHAATVLLPSERAYHQARAALAHSLTGDAALARRRVDEVLKPLAEVGDDLGFDFQAAWSALLTIFAEHSDGAAARKGADVAAISEALRAAERSFRSLAIPAPEVSALVWLTVGAEWVSERVPGEDHPAGLPGADEANARLEDHIRLGDHRAVFEELVRGVRGYPRIWQRRPGARATAERLLGSAEEFVWLMNGPTFAVAWCELADAWTHVGDAERVEAACRNAFDRSDLLTMSVGPLETADVPAHIVLPFAAMADHLLRSGAMLRMEANLSPAQSADAAAPPNVERTVAELPEVPAQLVETCASGAAVLVIGPEFPRLRGGPTRWDALIKVVRARAGDRLTGRAVDRVIESLTEGDADPAAQLLDVEGRQDARAELARIYSAGDPSEAYTRLAELNFAAVIDMSWDRAALAAFKHRDPSVLYPDSEKIVESNRGADFTFAWLFGEPSDLVSPLLMTPSEVRGALHQNETLGRFISGLEQSRTLVFVGVRPEDVDDFFESLPPSRRRGSGKAGATGPHYAFVEEGDLWELQRKQMPVRLGVELIGLPSDRADALPTMIERLTDRARPTEDWLGPADPDRPILNRVRLENIGVFDELDLELGPTWNLLLGDNGCGKSTVLKAVAMGLCGDHPRATEAGERLLRVGTDEGSIELTVGTTIYRTELTRTSGTVRVYSTSLTPLQEGRWAVLGFPALRGVSVSAPTGTVSGPSLQPHVNDLLPLLFGQVDSRLDDLKQWIINVESRTHQKDGERWTQLLTKFFEVLRELTPGLDVSFHGVDRESWDVLVMTDDGVVPIDRLSQGMNSILGWVGTVLQRMYDIYPNSPSPTNESAFVLIDEVDAHLHPGWQRMLPSLVRRHFTNVQYLATSHSPLLAGGLEPEEIFVARREPRIAADGNQVTVAEITRAAFDTEGLRADQILTSPLFGLPTTRGPDEQQTIREYSRLLGLQERTAEEEETFAELQTKLSGWMSDGENETLRESEGARARYLEFQKRPFVSAEDITKERAVEMLTELDGLSAADGATE